MTTTTVQTRTLTDSEIMTLWNICRTAERVYAREAKDGLPQFKEKMAEQAKQAEEWASIFLAFPKVTIEPT